MGKVIDQVQFHLHIRSQIKQKAANSSHLLHLQVATVYRTISAAILENRVHQSQYVKKFSQVLLQ